MEIERKYLVRTIPQLENIEGTEILQAYLNKDPEIRIRRKTKSTFISCFLTIKNDGTIAREEIEVPINLEAFEHLLIKADCVIKKIRYEIPLKDNLVAELDLYKDRELVVVEVEFPNINVANQFVPPTWFGKEITKIRKYKNKELAYEK